MAGAYIPLIGGGNVVSLVDTGAAAFLNGTINGTVVTGRPGNMKTVLLVGMDNAATPDIPVTTAAALFTLRVAVPAGFPMPDAASDNFDYSALLPQVTATAIARDFTLSSAAFPATLAAFYGDNAAPDNLATIYGRLSAISVPDTTHPYGTLTFAFEGAASTAAITDALVQVVVDFGASVAS